jgi:hypothetical protein
MAVNEAPLIFEGRRSTWVMFGVALAGWVVVLIGLQVARVQTHFAYLTAFAFVTSIALGALIFLMTTYVVGATWNASVRRLNECIVSVMPVLAVCFLPIAFGLHDLYLWTESASSLPEHEQHLLAHKQAYLNPPFFIARAALYFALWTLAALALCRWSVRRDVLTRPDEGPPAGLPPTETHPPVPASASPHAASPALEPHARERAFSSVGLPLVALALTFAAFDWLMSLQPFWMSSIFGVYYFAGGFVASIGLLVALAHAAARSGSDLIRPSHFHALGRLMFGFTVFWAYIAFFQALLISLPNRPEEVVFYLRRLEGGWRGVAWALLALRFLVPFFVLLPRDIKFRGHVMAVVGLGLVAGQYLDMYWLVMPIGSEHGPHPTLWDLAALCAVAGTCGVAGALWLRGKAIVPIGDPVLEQSVAYRSPL